MNKRKKKMNKKRGNSKSDWREAEGVHALTHARTHAPLLKEKEEFLVTIWVKLTKRNPSIHLHMCCVCMLELCVWWWWWWGGGGVTAVKRSGMHYSTGHGVAWHACVRA